MEFLGKTIAWLLIIGAVSYAGFFVYAAHQQTTTFQTPASDQITDPALITKLDAIAAAHR